LFIIARTSP